MKKTRIKAKDLNSKIEEFGVSYSKKDSIELWKDRDANLTLYVVNGEINFFEYESWILPTLKLLQKELLLKKVVVDMGAVKFVVSGADIMRPGIVEIDSSIFKDEFVVVVDVNNGKALAIGIALFSGSEISGKGSGKVIKNIHYVGDDLWNL